MEILYVKGFHLNISIIIIIVSIVQIGDRWVDG